MAARVTRMVWLWPPEEGGPNSGQHPQRAPQAMNRSRCTAGIPRQQARVRVMVSTRLGPHW